MKKTLLLLAGALLMHLPGVCLAQGPHQAGGFVLGENIAGYEGRLLSGTAMPAFAKGFLEEIKVIPPPGFRAGILTYGACAAPGRIVRIELKYEDFSREFFDELAKRLTERFGKAEYTGDSFHVFLAWKWTFTDADNNRITLKIQHNAKDDEQRIGNVVKLTMTTLMDAERECWEKESKAEFPKADSGSKASVSWDQLLPR